VLTIQPKRESTFSNPVFWGFGWQTIIAAILESDAMQALPSAIENLAVK